MILNNTTSASHGKEDSLQPIELSVTNIARFASVVTRAQYEVILTGRLGGTQ